MPTRRRFLAASARAGALALAARAAGATGVDRLASRPASGRPLFPDPARGWRGESSLAAALRAGSVPEPQELPGPAAPRPRLNRRFRDLQRHFIFEYYPWYGTDPYRHWEQWDRVPPLDLASHYVPSLGAYDSRSAAVVERHAQWIAGSGVGAINVSWWGPGSYEDRAVPLLMDVMRDHGIKVTFHLEPYTEDHVSRFADDVLYLLHEYGEKRKWDAFLLLEDAEGRTGPVVKGFRTILPESVTDCHGSVQRVGDYAPDALWRRQNFGLRGLLSQDFDHLTLLADSLDFERTQAAGFDGIAIYDNFVSPSSYAAAAAAASQRDLVFSFNVNPGYDGIEPRRIDPAGCYAPAPFVPPAELDWSRADDRERAAQLAGRRIAECLDASLAAQADPRLANARKGFLLVYVNSFNEWHEGHAFEPMKSASELSSGERVWGYHDPEEGGYRLAALKAALQGVWAQSAGESGRSA